LSVVYGREVDGKETTFGTTGYTYNSIFMLYDRLTKTVWYPLDDGAFDGVGGEKLGGKIPFLAEPPIVTLGQWRKEHPNTQVLLKDGKK